MARKILRRKTRVKKYTKAKPKTVSQAVKKYVKRTIHSNIENKVANINSGDNFGNISNNPILGSYPMLPLTGYWTVSQGVTSNTRNGNQLKVRKVMLNYVLRPMIYQATTNPYACPCEIDLFLGYVKRSPASLPTSTDIGNLFQNGASVLAPVGALPDLISDINKDYWHIAKRWRHKIGFSNNNGTGSTTPISAQTQYFQNNDFRMNEVRKLDITRHLPTKNIKFNDADGTSQKNLFFFYQALYADGTVMTSLIEPIHIDFWIKFEYEDA